MQITKSVLSYETVDTSGLQIPAIIVAAGKSARMNGENKQFSLIKGIPVLVRSIMAFEKCGLIKSITVVTRGEDLLTVQKLCEEYSLKKVTDIVEGGANRSESVKCGLATLAKGEKLTLIHDGARPFVTEKMITDVAAALLSSDCAFVAVGPVDTVKETAGDGRVTKTLDRSRIVLAQTPQGVNLAKYRFAINSLKAADYTDDASLMEAMGYKCVVCRGSRSNIKITHPEDIAIANAILQTTEGEK